VAKGSFEDAIAARDAKVKEIAGQSSKERNQVSAVVGGVNKQTGQSAVGVKKRCQTKYSHDQFPPENALRGVASVPTLKELSAIPWNQKSVASGKAATVPQALAGLVSPDDTVRNRSYWQLDNEVVLQSDLYEAAYFAIPFLIQFLSEKVAHGRDRIHGLLYEIAHGEAPSTIVCRTTEGKELPLKEACARELEKGMSVFLSDTSDPNPLIREKAKDLIEVLTSNAAGNSTVPEGKCGVQQPRPIPPDRHLLLPEH